METKLKQKVDPKPTPALTTAAMLRYTALEYEDLLTKRGKDFLEELAKRIEDTFFD